MVISSIIITFEEKSEDDLIRKINEFPQVTLLEKNENKYAALIEADSTDYSAYICEQIRSLQFVEDLDIISHFFEEEVLNN